MYFKIYNNMKIKVWTFITCYFVFFQQISYDFNFCTQTWASVKVHGFCPICLSHLWMVCLNLAGQRLHKSRNWSSGRRQQAALSYCVMFWDHVAWPCGVHIPVDYFWYLLETEAWWPVNGVIVGSDDGLSPAQYQTISWTSSYFQLDD